MYSEDYMFRKNIPPILKQKCLLQNWKDIEIKNGLREGQGVFTKKVIKKGTCVCNYGGHFFQEKYVKKNLLPFEENSIIS